MGFIRERLEFARALLPGKKEISAENQGNDEPILLLLPLTILYMLGHPIGVLLGFSFSGSEDIETNTAQVHFLPFIIVILSFGFARLLVFCGFSRNATFSQNFRGFMQANAPAALGLPLTYLLSGPIEGNVFGFIIFPIILVSLLLVPVIFALSLSKLYKLRKHGLLNVEPSVKVCKKSFFVPSLCDRWVAKWREGSNYSLVFLAIVLMIGHPISSVVGYFLPTKRWAEDLSISDAFQLFLFFTAILIVGLIRLAVFSALSSKVSFRGILCDFVSANSLAIYSFPITIVFALLMMSNVPGISGIQAIVVSIILMAFVAGSIFVIAPKIFFRSLRMWRGLDKGGSSNCECAPTEVEVEHSQTKSPRESLLFTIRELMFDRTDCKANLFLIAISIILMLGYPLGVLFAYIYSFGITDKVNNFLAFWAVILMVGFGRLALFFALSRKATFQQNMRGFISANAPAVVGILYVIVTAVLSRPLAPFFLEYPLVRSTMDILTFALVPIIFIRSRSRLRELRKVAA